MLRNFGGFDYWRLNFGLNGSSVSGQLAVELKKLRQKFAFIGPGTRPPGSSSLGSFKFHSEPSHSRTPPSLFSILPGEVNYRDTRTSGDEVGDYKLKHHFYHID